MKPAADNFNAKRGLRPAAELAAARPHGDRLRYIGGCRCDACRKANSTYERERQKARAAGDWNGIVSAAPARRHLRKLSRQGVGRRAVQAVTDIADTILSEIRSGKRKNIRARTERRILGVTVEAMGDAALVPAGPTWALIDAMLAAGHTKSSIALGLGRKTPALQLNRNFVTLRNAAAVQRLHARLMGADEALVDAKRAKGLIRELRAEWIATSRIAAELDLTAMVEDGEIRLPARITCALEKRIVELHERMTS